MRCAHTAPIEPRLDSPDTQDGVCSVMGKTVLDCIKTQGASNRRFDRSFKEKLRRRGQFVDGTTQSQWQQRERSRDRHVRGARCASAITATGRAGLLVTNFSTARDDFHNLATPRCRPGVSILADQSADARERWKQEDQDGQETGAHWYALTVPKTACRVNSILIGNIPAEHKMISS